MSESASFEYTLITIPLACLKSLWTLSLSENEWGGRFTVNSNCTVGCDIDLVEGSVLETQAGPQTMLYLGKDKAFDADKKLKPIRLASIYIRWICTPTTCESGVKFSFPPAPPRARQGPVAGSLCRAWATYSCTACCQSNVNDKQGHGVHRHRRLRRLLPLQRAAAQFRQMYDQRAKLMGEGKARQKRRKSCATRRSTPSAPQTKPFSPR